MKTLSVIDGPILESVGWLIAPDYQPIISSSQQIDNTAPSPCTFCHDGSYILEGIEHGVIDIPFSIRKQSGVARSRSVCKATIFASILCGEFLKKCFTSSENIGIAMVSSSSTIPIAWEFESSGVSEGWDATDTMLLPSSIPSAISTQVAAAHDLHSTALTFLDGILGACSAIEYATLCFHYQRAHQILVVCAEEVSKPQQIAADQINYVNSKLLFNGATGLTLSAPAKISVGWQFRIIHRYSTNEKVEFPPEWGSHSEYYELILESKLTSFTSWLLPLFINQAVHKATGNRIILKCGLENVGGFIFGLERK